MLQEPSVITYLVSRMKNILATCAGHQYAVSNAVIIPSGLPVSAEWAQSHDLIVHTSSSIPFPCVCVCAKGNARVNNGLCLQVLYVPDPEYVSSAGSSPSLSPISPLSPTSSEADLEKVTVRWPHLMHYSTLWGKKTGQAWQPLPPAVIGKNAVSV